MFEIIDYSPEKLSEWNNFVEKAKNATFLFNRNYMDYHSDRFRDCSLMIYRKGVLYAILPANVSGTRVYSHQGLTYGGLLTDKKATVTEVLEVFNLIHNKMKDMGITHVVYKAIPYIYHQIPAQEDLYALFKLVNARIIGRNISSTIYQQDKIRFTESRKSGIRKAKNNNITVTESRNFNEFWKILESNLLSQYGAKPVHSLEEITLLAERFPENIRLFLAISDNLGVLGGTVVYETNKNVVHTQYISASPEGKAMGALDAIFDYLVNDRYKNIPFFDFGQSTEQMGHILNESLIFQKEGFGGRGVAYDIYEYEL